MNYTHTSIFDSRFLLLGFLAVSAAILVAVNTESQNTQISDENKATAQEYVREAYLKVREGMSLAQAKSLNEKALTLEPKNEGALYNLARINYILGDHAQSLHAIAEYKDTYPEKKRIHYIAGLSNAYAGNLAQAKIEFQDFIASGLSTWPGYLDLAWVHYQLGEFDDAQMVLEEGVAQFGENAWLLTSLGGVHMALGNTENAKQYLHSAAELAKQVTIEDWQSNYSFNDPSNAEREVGLLNETIAYNLDVIAGKEVDEAKILTVPFADPSPLGVGQGVVVSACGDSCPHTTCYPENVCGVSNTGEYISCLGQCSVSAPADPSGTCSVSTECGTATGFNGCNGGCNIVEYPVCGDNEGTVVVGDGTFSPSEVNSTIQASPLLVVGGSTTYIQWATTETTSCTIEGENGDSWDGVYGEEETSPIFQETDYVLTCTAFDSSEVTTTVTVRVVPIWQEF